MASVKDFKACLPMLYHRVRTHTIFVYIGWEQNIHSQLSRGLGTVAAENASLSPGCL